MAINLRALQDLLGEGFERARQTSFNPIELQKRGFSALGEILEKTPETKVELPEAKEQIAKMEGRPGVKGIFLESLAYQPKIGTKLFEGITSIPGEWLRSYGKTSRKIGTDQKLDFEDYLNISDFIPGIGFVGIGGGVKAIAKKELVKKVGKEVVEETAEKVTKETAKDRLRHLLTYNDTLKKMYNLSDEKLKTIGWKRAKEILDTLPNQLKEQVRGKEPISMNELSYMFKKPGMDVKKKISIIDYLRTPEQVLDKIGLTKEKEALRLGYDNYQAQLREELIRIKSWRDRVSRKDSTQTIFDYLDGTLDAKALNPEELTVANEIKVYLKNWAKRLGLPEEKQITNYITHLFERTQEGVEFPMEIAKKIKDQTAGSVYDPFLMQRTGKPEFVRDTWRALEAYVKRGTRKVNLDSALEMLKKVSNDLDPATEKYIKNLSHRINLRPTDVDELLDNLIKQSPIGYKFTARPTAYLSNKWRMMIYRGALGLNPASALRNLSQGINTYAVLGEKYTILGYADMFKHMLRRDYEELLKHGVLLDNIVIDRSVHVRKKVMEKIDDVLFSLFDGVEKINRASAYFGAKKQALDKGMSIPNAIDYAKGIVRKTQFAFSQIDQPVGLASDLAKTFAQFQNYPIKQAEFLGNLVKDKDFVGMLRYIAGSVAFYSFIGKVFGMDLKEFIPFKDLRFTSPAGQAVGAIGDLFSSDERRQEEGRKRLANTLSLLIPAGVQTKKTIQGAVAGERGYTATPTGRVRYPVGQDPLSQLQLLLFGQYAPQQAKEYYGRDRSPLGEKQTEEFKRLGLPYYERIMREREEK